MQFYEIFNSPGLGLAKHLAEVWISHREEDLVDVGAQVTLLQQSSSQL